LIVPITGQSKFEIELKKIIDEEIDRLSEVLEAGVGIPDYAKYQNIVGQIYALRLVANEYCFEANDTIEKR